MLLQLVGPASRRRAGVCPAGAPPSHNHSLRQAEPHSHTQTGVLGRKPSTSTQPLAPPHLRPSPFLPYPWTRQRSAWRTGATRSPPTTATLSAISRVATTGPRSARTPPRPYPPGATMAVPGAECHTKCLDYISPLCGVGRTPICTSQVDADRFLSLALAARWLQLERVVGARAAFDRGRTRGP